MLKALHRKALDKFGICIMVNLGVIEYTHNNGAPVNSP